MTNFTARTAATIDTLRDIACRLVESIELYATASAELSAAVSYSITCSYTFDAPYLSAILAPSRTHLAQAWCTPGLSHSCIKYTSLTLP